MQRQFVGGARLCHQSLSGRCDQVGGIYIQGNFIGTDISGSLARGNGFGVSLSPGIAFGPNSTRNLVGDQVFEDGGLIAPQNRNVIAANALDGVYIGSLPGSPSALDHRIRNNTIGLNAAGTAALPNGRHGIFADVGSNATKIEDNLIAGNVGDGVRLVDNAAPANLLRNGIGIGENGVALGNGGYGVYVGGTSKAVSIGGRYAFSPFGASIANNGSSGVYVADSGIVDSGGFIANNGVTANDNLDADTGPNGLLNYPIITSATRDLSTGEGILTGTLNTTPGFQTTINFYYNESCDASGYGGAETFLSGASVNVTPDAQGNATFSRNVSFLPLGKFITAQSRRFSTTPGSIEVSELSACRQVVAAGSLFTNGFE
jgi:trimeric autotransporter adhesin